jgi:hypothetical protein
VVIATPDAAIADTARDLAPGSSPARSWCTSRAAWLDALASSVRARPDVRVGALHPLQTLRRGRAGQRAPGCVGAVAGRPRCDGSRDARLRPFASTTTAGRVPRGGGVASNHLVALLGQVERLADAAACRPTRFCRCATTRRQRATRWPGAALTGPVARGDADTVARHLDALPDASATRTARSRSERSPQRRDDAALRALLQGEPA